MNHGTAPGYRTLRLRTRGPQIVRLPQIQASRVPSFFSAGHFINRQDGTQFARTDAALMANPEHPSTSSTPVSEQRALISQRKTDHINLCASGEVEFRSKGTLFDDLQLIHDARCPTATSTTSICARRSWARYWRRRSSSVR